MNDPAMTVVGFQGIVTPGRTPGLHAPVVVDAQGRLVDAHGVVDGVVLSPDPNDTLPGDATRIGPWPHDPAGVVLTADLPILRQLRQRYLHDVQMTTSLRRLLDALDDPNSITRLRGERAERVQGTHVVAWYGPRDEVLAMRVFLRDLALAELDDALSRSDDARVEQKAWGLQRAALTPTDDLRAIAALQAAGMEAAEARELRDELVRDLSPREREAAYKRVSQQIQRLRQHRVAQSAQTPRRHDQGAAWLARERVRNDNAIRRRVGVAV